MCFSVQVNKDIKEIARRFSATPLIDEFYGLKNLQEFEAQAGPEKMKAIMGLKRRPQSSVFKAPEDDGRVYPNTFAPVITMHDGKRAVRPMRYRVRPQGSSEEIPSKYNVFNARIDSLEKRKTWSSLFMKNHGLFPFYEFYEWVDDSGKKRLIRFRPKDADMMWAPCLYDTWTSRDGKVSFSSFAIITDDPPPEVEEMGHDRCPIFLNEEQIDLWLAPKLLDKESAYSILKDKTNAHFESEFD